MNSCVEGENTTFQIRWIHKYTTVERFLHWLHTFTFLPLALTGLILYAPWLGSLAQGSAGMTIRLIHRVAAVLFGGVPILYLILQPRRVALHLREFLSFGKYDLLWLKAVVPYYLFGRETEMPPQPRFNTGERLNAVVMVVGTFLFGLTGLPMWFARASMPVELYQVLVAIHDIVFTVTMVMFIVHLYLAVVHPLMWQSLVSMRFGSVSESYARAHHAAWYCGEERARQMWEAQQKEHHKHGKQKEE